MKEVLLQPDESHEIEHEYAIEISDIDVGGRKDFSLEVRVGILLPIMVLRLPQITGNIVLNTFRYY